MVHTLKIKPKYFNDGIYTGKSIRAVITYLLKHNDFPVGIPKDYVVFSIEIIKQN